MRTGGDKTHRRLVQDALKLFTEQPYDKVTFNVLERGTKLSRGAILYHVDNKETLFREAAELFVFYNNPLPEPAPEDSHPLLTTIKRFVEIKREEQDFWREHGIPNINYARIMMTISSFSLFPDSRENARQLYRKEADIWKLAIEQAIERGEIRPTDPQLTAELFLSTYIGTAQSGMMESEGYNVDTLHDLLMKIYSLLAV
jgi:AcrR family transcriptional regulator